jgi:hypothetical protein
MVGLSHMPASGTLSPIEIILWHRVIKPAANGYNPKVAT